MSPYRTTSPPLEIPEVPWTPTVGDKVIVLKRREKMQSSHVGEVGEILDFLGKMIVVIFRDRRFGRYVMFDFSELVRVV